MAVSRLEKAPREVLAGPREYVGFREDRAERRVHVAVGFLTVGSGPGPAARLGRLGLVRERGRKGGLLHRRRPELAGDGRRATHAPVSRRPLRRRVGVPSDASSPPSSHRARAQRAVRSRARGRNAAHSAGDGTRRPRRVRRQPRVRAAPAASRPRGRGPRREQGRSARARRAQQPRRGAAELLVPAGRSPAPAQRRPRPALLPESGG